MTSRAWTRRQLDASTGPVLRLASSLRALQNLFYLFATIPLPSLASMPEADIVVGVERTFKKYQYQRHFLRGQLSSEPRRVQHLCRELCLLTTFSGIIGRLVIFPSNFAKGSAAGTHPICSVTDLGFDHAQHPAPEGFIPDPYDAARSKGEAWEPFLKPLPVGNVFVHSRGRECVVTAGPVSLTSRRCGLEPALTTHVASSLHSCSVLE